MSADKSTPIPWRIESVRGGRVLIISAGMAGDGPAKYVVRDELGMEMADAELIVRAVNAHDDLVEASRPFQLKNLPKVFSGDIYNVRVTGAEILALRAAIAKAGAK